MKGGWLKLRQWNFRAFPFVLYPQERLAKNSRAPTLIYFRIEYTCDVHLMPVVLRAWKACVEGEGAAFELAKNELRNIYVKYHDEIF
jgi:hypothetical protein